MAPNCYICNSNVPKTKSIFRIPDRHDEYCERGNLWLKILDADAGCIDKIRICSEHFLKSNYDIKHTTLHYITEEIALFFDGGLNLDLREHLINDSLHL